MVYNEESENKKLISKNEGGDSNFCTYSKARRIGILTTSLSLLFFTLCFDFIIYPFFPKVAINKGFTNTEIGVVYTAYNFAKLVSSSITAILVSQ